MTLVTHLVSAISNMKRICAIILVSSCCLLSVQAQDYIVKGRVTDAKTQEALPLASVFFNNTTIGTMSDDEGYFELPVDPAFRELVVSFVGYETITFTLDMSELDVRYKFEMEPDTRLLEVIEVEAERSEVWYRNLEYFLDRFIGRSKLASNTILENPETIYFDTQGDVFRVFAREPLRITNKDLGYEITYILELFELDHKNNTLTSLGYPRFQEMEARKRKKKRYAKNRDIAYKGSLSHFLKSVCDDKHKSEGFEVWQVHLKENPNYPTEEQIEWANTMRRELILTNARAIPDSAVTILREAREPKFYRVMPKKSLKEIRGLSSTEAGYSLTFEDLWYVEYKHEKADPNYIPPGRQGRMNGPLSQNSYISLPRGAAAMDQACLLINPLDIRIEEYWGFENLAEMLPTDYLIKQTTKE